MKLINNVVFFKISESSHLMINTLNGLIDELDEPSYNTIKAWGKAEYIEPSGKDQTSLYNALLKRGYLVQSRDEESSIKEDIIAKLRAKHGANRAVKHMEFLITYDCNFRCPYCYESGRAAKNAVISKEMVDAAFSIAGATTECVSLFGGEPLLPENRDVIEYILSCAEETHFYITTNGYYLLEFMDLFSKAKTLELHITLDGDEQTHDSLRYLEGGKPTYQKILKGIEYCLTQRHPVTIRMNVGNDNVNKCLEHKKELMRTLPSAEEFLNIELHPRFQLANQERNAVMEVIHKNTQTAPYAIGYPIMNVFAHGMKLKPLYSFCHAHNNFSYIFDPFGYIYPCKNSVAAPDYATGTYFPEVKFYENSILHRNIETVKECRECNYTFLCAGGCPMQLDSREGFLRPNCQQTMNDFTAQIPVLYNMYAKKEQRK